MRSAAPTFIACALVFSSIAHSRANAQSFNVDVGPVADPPSSSYGGAGLAGHWNSLVAAHNTTTFNLRDVNGVVTPVRVWQYGGTSLLTADDPATAGDDDALMDDCLLTFTSNLETCLFFYDLQPGSYEVTIYAWMPNQPAIRSYTSSDEEPGYPHKIVGGAWPGGHQNLVTYSRHNCIVTTGLLRTHSGIVPGHNPALGAAFNGVQIRKLPPYVAGDMNCDGALTFADVADFARALADENAYRTAHPACNWLHADIDGDGSPTGKDITGFVGMLLEP